MKVTGLGVLGYVLINSHLWPPKVAAAIVNLTIDDQFGDSVTGRRPTYSPALNIWNNQVTCDPNCAIRPKAAYAYDGTYTAAVYRPNSTGSLGISMQFIGIAIYVYFTLPNNETMGIINLTTANFTIDDNPPVLFIHVPNLSTTTVQYQALVFARANLSNTLHTLNITIMGPVSVYVNFDYAIYTQDDMVSATSVLSSATTSTSQKPSTSDAVPYSKAATGPKTLVGAVIGGVAGGIVITVFVVFLLFRWHRRGGHDTLQRVRRSRGPVSLITEFDISGSPVSTPGMSYTQTPVRSGSEASIFTPQLSNQIGNNSGNTPRGGSVRPSRRNKLLTVLAWNRSNATVASTSGGMPRSGHEDHHVSHPNTREPTREDIRRERQEELDSRLRMVHQEMAQVTAGPGASSPSRRSQTLETTSGEADLSVSDMRAEVLLMREQIRVLGEQQRSSWAQGLSDEPPPGYMPSETRARNSMGAS